MLVRCIFLVLLLVVLVVPFLLSFICNGAELGVQLELTLKRAEGGGHCHNLFVIWGFCSPESLCFKPVKLALCRGREGLMGDGGMFKVVSKSGRTISTVWLLNTPTEDL
jgi:hypothetical protein